MFSALALLVLTLSAGAEDGPRGRARDFGVVPGVFTPGPLNALTDVAGVKVGHKTLIEGDRIRTGVTAIIPGPGNLYTHPMPAWIHVGNGYGKLIGETQVREFGELETPLVLTCTLCVWSAARGLVDWLYDQPGMGEHTINPIVGETNDGRVNDMWSDPVQPGHVREALEAAKGGPIAEGSVGAGTGTQAFGWKGGIGTSSRVLPESLGGWTLGVLVQTNYGGFLTINGAPVGRTVGACAGATERRFVGVGDGFGEPGLPDPRRRPQRRGPDRLCGRWVPLPRRWRHLDHRGDAGGSLRHPGHRGAAAGRRRHHRAGWDPRERRDVRLLGGRLGRRALRAGDDLGRRGRGGRRARCRGR